MSEVEKHYGMEPGPAGHHAAGDGPPSHDPSAAATSTGAAGRAAQRVKDAVGQAQDAVGQVVERARGRAEDARDWAAETLDDASLRATYARRRSMAHINRGRRTAESFVDENPIVIGVVGLAAGLLIGSLLPATRRENRVLGPYADDVRDQGLRYAQDIAEQGRSLVEENIGKLGRTGADRDGDGETRT